MIARFNHFLDTLSNFLAVRKGLVPLLGLVMILVNLVLQFIPGVGWLASTNLFLHVGLILAIIGMMLAWAL
jgi:uncharacterized membrane protein